MKDMKVKEALFPMITAHRADHIPAIYVILRSQSKLIDYLDGGRRQKEQQKAAEEDYEKVQDAKNKKAKEKQEKKEQDDRKEEMVNQLLRQKQSYAFLKGLGNMTIFSLFAILLIGSVKQMTLVQEILQMKMSINHQFF